MWHLAKIKDFDGEDMRITPTSPIERELIQRQAGYIEFRTVDGREITAPQRRKIFAMMSSFQSARRRPKAIIASTSKLLATSCSCSRIPRCSAASIMYTVRRAKHIRSLSMIRLASRTSVTTRTLRRVGGGSVLRATTDARVSAVSPMSAGTPRTGLKTLVASSSASLSDRW